MDDYDHAHRAAYREACRKHRQAVKAATRKREQARAEVETTYRHALTLAAHAYRKDMEHADRALYQAVAADDGASDA